MSNFNDDEYFTYLGEYRKKLSCEVDALLNISEAEELLDDEIRVRETKKLAAMVSVLLSFANELRALAGVENVDYVKLFVNIILEDWEIPADENPNDQKQEQDLEKEEEK